jgi:ATP-binding cassette subfamily B (MDR/TAP) protein 1
VRLCHNFVHILTPNVAIKSNILYAVSDKVVSDEEVYTAAKAANAHDFIIALPDGYNTILGERGVSLSGGQKQRIAIARAMIQNPSLLLLDEATSALDTTSEALVQEALNNLMVNRTSIVIAHRLTTIVDSDIICVMHKGEMKEQGSHKELLQIPNGYYFKLAQKQMKFGSDPNKENTTTSDSDDESSSSDTPQAVNVKIVQ